MADEDEEDAGPVVELGEGDRVEGAPLARVASRLYYGIEASEVVRREGETEIRTPDGPREIGDVLDDVDDTYFDTRQAFVSAVQDAVGTGPVPTADGEREADDEAGDEGEGTDAEASGDDGDDTDDDGDDADDE